MRNSNVHKKHLRGRPLLQVTEDGLGESVLETWVRGLRSIPENPKDSLRGYQRRELTAQERNTGSRPNGERWQASPLMPLWRDDGGESG